MSGLEALIASRREASREMTDALKAYLGRSQARHDHRVMALSRPGLPDERAREARAELDLAAERVQVLSAMIARQQRAGG